MRRGTRTTTLLAALALVAAGCSSGGGDSGGGDGGTSLIVWTIEDLPDRLTAQKKMAQEFTEKTGIKTNVLAVGEDQFGVPVDTVF